MAESGRETRRRRRILEQGSDRLAFITGRIQTLPPQPQPQHASSPSDADAAPSFQPQQLISNDPNTTLNTTLPHGEAEDKSESVVLNRDSHTDPSHSEPDACISRSQTPSLHKLEPENEISSVPTSQDEDVQPSPDSIPDIIGARHQSQPPPQSNKPKLLITPSELSSAINASRDIRLFCSIAVALLVVASYRGFSLLGIRLIKNVVSFRPLYLVLVTNLSVVAARVLSGKQRGFDERSNRRQNIASDDGDQWGTELARTLEYGLVMQNVVDAVFIDCAVYAIIVICGVSLV